MRVPYSWLKEFLDWDGPLEELARRLTMSGVEVEEVEQWAEGGASDSVLLTKVTANRGDLLSLLGLARHAAATLRVQRFPLEFSLPPPGPPVEDDVAVEIADPIGCPRYSAMLVRGVLIADSPPWMQERLAAAGMRPINNVVDCTNYVMWELGQPLHAFDAQLLATDEQGRAKIVVRRAGRGETLISIDSQERALDPADVVIADPEKAVALAGVMGGQETEVNPNTMDVLIESAHFDRVAIRRTAQRLGMDTEASHRFERVVDPRGTIRAAERCAQLMVATSGGEVAAGAVDAYPGQRELLELELRTARANALLGTDIPPDAMSDYLKALDMDVSWAVAATSEQPRLRVVVPSFRPDIEREVDLVEEVAIVHGYENIEGTLPGAVTASGMYTERQRKLHRLGQLLRAGGLCETINLAMADPNDLTRIGLPEDARERNTLKLQRATDEGLSAMRTTLLPPMLAAAEHNANQRVTDVGLYEINPVFLPSGTEDAPAEPLRVGVVVMGSFLDSRWNEPPHVGVADFYLLKGIIQQTLDGMGLTRVVWQPGEHPTFRQGHCAAIEVDGEYLGVAGEVATEVQEEFSLPRKAFLAELDVELILDKADLYRPHHPLPRYPAALRDLAVVVEDTQECSAARLAEAMREAGAPLLVAVEPFDVFVDEKRLGPGKRSIAFSLEFRAPDHTLTDEEVNGCMDGVIQVLTESFRAAIRES
jgi:phenylalanyl-tRNA synthetase beta chain